MLNISIDKEKTIVQNTKTGGQWTVKTTKLPMRKKVQ